MTSYTNHEKRIWEDTEAGQLHVKIKKFFSSGDNGAKWEDADQRWIDKHRAKSLTMEGELIEEFEKAQLAVKAEYKEKFDNHMLKIYQDEYNYLLEVAKRPEPTKE